MNTSPLEVLLYGLVFGGQVLACLAAFALTVAVPASLILKGPQIWTAATSWCRFSRREQTRHEHAVAACLFAVGNRTRQGLCDDPATGTREQIDAALVSLCARGVVARKTISPTSDLPYFELTPEGETILGSEMSP